MCVYPGTGDELPGANMVVRVYVAQKRKIQVGDKRKAGIRELFPNSAPGRYAHLPDGTSVDIVLNPVPSRMNVGQVFECLLGWAGQFGLRFKLTPFDEMYGWSHRALWCMTNSAEVTGKEWLFNQTRLGN